MAFIGNTPTTQAFTPAIDYFSGNGSTTAFTLSRPVASVAQVQVTIDNVAQNPSSAYTVSSNTITFTSAPLSGTNNIYVYYTSPITQVIAPGQGTVNTTALGNITNIASGNSSLTLQTGSSNTTAVTVDTSQNVLVGLTSAISSFSKTIQIQDSSSAAICTSITGANARNWFTGCNSNGLYSVYDSTAGAYRLNIDSSGRVGIGTTTTSNATLTVNNADLTSPLYIGSQSDSSSWGGFFVNGATSSTAGNGIYGKSGASFYYNVATGLNHIWTQNGGEKMRINTNGYLKASNTGTYQTTAGAFHEFYTTNADNTAKFGNSNAVSPYGPDISYLAAAPNNTGNNFLYCSDTGGQRLGIRANGGIANYSANNVNLSDRREKTNFAPAKSYLNTICSIPVQTFNYIDQNLEQDDGLTLGVVAQDVQEVAPELVQETNWARKDEEPKIRLSIYQTDLQYALMKSIQELKAINDTQAETINALTARIEALEAK